LTGGESKRRHWKGADRRSDPIHCSLAIEVKIMAVRAKFVCKEISNSSPNTDENGKTVKLEAVINGSDENKEFFRWTPSGQISFGCVNAKASEQL
jgi:hypothetical protein